MGRAAHGCNQEIELENRYVLGLPSSLLPLQVGSNLCGGYILGSFSPLVNILFSREFLTERPRGVLCKSPKPLYADMNPVMLTLKISHHI